MLPELQALRGGAMTFVQFERATRLEWYRLAAYLLRRWQAPAAAGLDDLVQEMLLEAWRVVGRYDPRRGVRLDKYVTWNAVNVAKKWLHRQRRAYKLDDRSPSRHPLCLSSLDEDAPRRLEPVADCDVEEEADRTRQIAVALSRLTDELDRELFLRLVDARGDLDRAARAVSESAEARWMWRVEDEAGARRAIRRVLRRAAASSDNGRP